MKVQLKKLKENQKKIYKHQAKIIKEKYILKKVMIAK